MSKRDKLGFHSTIERICVDVLLLSLESAFQSRSTKLTTLESLRVEIEILKHLIRSENELRIISDKQYHNLSEQLIEISKMTNGWIRFITQKEPS